MRRQPSRWIRALFALVPLAVHAGCSGPEKTTVRQGTQSDSIKRYADLSERYCEFVSAKIEDMREAMQALKEREQTAAGRRTIARALDEEDLAWNGLVSSFTEAPAAASPLLDLLLDVRRAFIRAGTAADRALIGHAYEGDARALWNLDEVRIEITQMDEAIERVIKKADALRAGR